MPAGAILISPWVDLTHSFPSVAGDGPLDYIPAHGFMQRPSASWPPPNAEDIKNIALSAVEQVAEEALPRKSSQAVREHDAEEAIRGLSPGAEVHNLPTEHDHQNTRASNDGGQQTGIPVPGPGHNLSLVMDGNLVEIKDQIQMYTTNQLISHPLVSPVLQPSLGGLPPLLILTGGGEVLRDEQIYLAHKAANPSKYPPGAAYLNEHAESREVVNKYKGTDVQLQVWDDLCHVAPTLSFTRPAKYMFRSIAQFGAWALARAQRTEIDIQDDDDMSVISIDSDSDTSLSHAGSSSQPKPVNGRQDAKENGRVGKAGEPLPPFKNHMIRQRVDRNGKVSSLGPPESLPALQLDPSEIGVIKAGPVTKWLRAKQEWDTKYVREKRRIQIQRAKEMAAGYQTFGKDEVPPPSALAGRRGLGIENEEKKGRSWGMSIWSLWATSHDEQTMEREEKADKAVETSTVSADPGSKTDSTRGLGTGRKKDQSRSRSRRRNIVDLGQSDHQDDLVDENTPAAALASRQKAPSPPTLQLNGQESDSLPQSSTDEILKNTTNRPIAGSGQAFPFKLGTPSNDGQVNASTVTLQSSAGVVPDLEGHGR